MKSLILLPAFLLSCTAGIDVVKESQTLLETDMQFAQMSIDKGAAAAFDHYLTDDAMQLPHKGLQLTGKDQILKSFGNDPEAFQLAWEPQKAEVAESGDMGWSWGKYELTVFLPDENKVTYGKYLNIWKKQEDGTWKVVVDMGNHSPEPEK